MITESKINGNLAVTITAKVTVVEIIAGPATPVDKVIVESMGERRVLMVGEDLDVVCSGIFNVEG